MGFKRTYCKHGHEWTAENTYLCKGKRYCRTCKRERVSSVHNNLAIQRKQATREHQMRYGSKGRADSTTPRTEGNGAK